MNECEQRNNDNGEIRWLIRRAHAGKRVALDLKTDSGIYLPRKDMIKPTIFRNDGLREIEVKNWMESKDMKTHKDYFYKLSRSLVWGILYGCQNSHILGFITEQSKSLKLSDSIPTASNDETLFSYRMEYSYKIHTSNSTSEENDYSNFHILLDKSGCCRWGGINNLLNPFSKAFPEGWPCRIAMNNELKPISLNQKSFAYTLDSIMKQKEVEEVISKKEYQGYTLWQHPLTTIVSNQDIPPYILELIPTVSSFIQNLILAIQKIINTKQPYNDPDNELGEIFESINTICFYYLDMHHYIAKELSKLSKRS